MGAGPQRTDDVSSKDVSRGFSTSGGSTRRQEVLNAPPRMTESMLEALDSHARSWSKEPGDPRWGEFEGGGCREGARGSGNLQGTLVTERPFSYQKRL